MDTLAADLKEDTSQEVYRKIKYYMFSISVLWIFMCTYFIGSLLAETMPFVLQILNKEAILIVRNDEWYASVCIVACAFFQDSHEWVLEKITDKRVVDIYRYGMLISDDFYFPVIARLGKEMLIYCGLGLFFHVAFSNVYLYEDKFSVRNPLTFEQEDYIISQIDSVKYISKKIYSNGGDRKSVV